MTTPAASTVKGRSGSGAAAIRPAPLHWRIKLYELEEEGAWIDKGTGFVHCKVVSELGGPALVIRSEENDGVIFFQSKVQADDVYEIQGDNIIMWREPDANGGIGVDYALSFQESSGCSAIWEQICSFQRQFLLQARAIAAEAAASGSEHVFAKPDAPPGHSHGPGGGGEGTAGAGSAGNGGGAARGGFGIGPILSILELSRSPTNSSRGSSVATSQGYGSNGALLVLPVDFAEEGCLQRIRYKLENLYPAQKEFAVCQLLNDDGAYMNKLFKIFDSMEAKRDIEGLNIMADIFRSVLLLNNPDVLEHLIGSDKVFYRLCGVMEYDKTLREQGAYRDFMFRQCRYREVVPLESSMGTAAQVEEVRSGCKVLYRLRYVRDIVLHPKIDDPGITAIGSMISFSSSEICTQMLQNTAYMARVLNVVWPALNIDNFLPAEEPQAPSSSQTVSPAHGEREDGTEGTAPGLGCSSGDSEEMVLGPLPAVPAVVQAVAGESSSPVVTPPLGSPVQPLSPANSTASSAVEGSPPALPEVAPESKASRPIDGLYFLRELFAMSKFLQVEKRVELFHELFEKLHQPLFLVLNKVLVECRAGSGVKSRSASDASAMVVDGETGASVVDLAPPLFAPEEQCVATQVVGEILTALCIVCSSLLRQVVLSNPVPAVNPLTAPAAAPASSNASVSGSTTPRGSVRKTFASGSAAAASSPAGGAWWEHSTLFLLIDGIVNSPDSFTIQSFGDVLKLVLDLEKAPSAAVKNDNYRFLTSFYDHYLAYLIVPYLENLDPSLPVAASFYTNLGITPHQACAREDGNEGNVQPFSAVQGSRRLIFETLIQCVTAHSYRFKYYAMRNSILSKLLSKSFQHQQQAWLHLLGIKFVKAVLSVKDEFYYKHIEKLDLLKNMLLMFREISHKDNLVTACFLDVVEDIRQLNIKNLVLYLVDKYAASFEGLHLQASVFQRLKIKYDQILDSSQDAAAGGRGAGGAAGGGEKYLTGVRGRQQRTFSDFDSEEDYFFGEDDGSLSSRDSQEHSARRFAGGEDHHRDKRFRGGEEVSAATIASIVHGAFEAKAPQSQMTSQNVINWQRASSAPNNTPASSLGGNGLNRTSSLGRRAGNTSPVHAPKDDGSSVQSNQSSTAGLRGSLMAMLGAYGIEDVGGDDDDEDSEGADRDPSALTHRNIERAAGWSAGKTSGGSGGGAEMNIYDEDDTMDKVSELSDCMSASDEEADGRGRSSSNEDCSPKNVERKRAGSGSSGEAFFSTSGVNDSKLEGNGQRSRKPDPFAGTDFVSSTVEEEGEEMVAAEDLADDAPAAEGLLPLPPLKSRFEYDDEDEGLSFLHKPTTAAATAAGAEVGVGVKQQGQTGGHISFSLKKKPKL